MAASRTGTARWKRIRAQAIARAHDEGQTKCPLCGVALDWEYAGRPNSAEVDHVKPFSAGGDDNLENVRVICRLDNQKLGGALNRRKPRAIVETVELDASPIW